MVQDFARHTKKEAPLLLENRTIWPWPWPHWKLGVAGLLLSLLVIYEYQLHGRKLKISRFMITRPEDAIPTSWEWSDIQPSRTLQWHRCYDDTYDCARLDVPMDWLDPSDDKGNRVVLAIMRLKATELDDYKGPIFFNPGGPGGSGVYALKDRGALLQTIAGKNHDIISFDPRGIGASVPRVECWDSQEKGRLWALQDVGVVSAHPGVVFDAFAQASALSQACEMNMRYSSLLSHISTASHARDLLEILHQTGQDKLKYWGFSYGTILGGVSDPRHLNNPLFKIMQLSNRERLNRLFYLLSADRQSNRFLLQCTPTKLRG